MASGQELAERNVNLFQSWRDAKTDADYRGLAYRGSLSRKDIAKECGFAKSVLDQNPRVKALLAELEANLRARGILPPELPRSDVLMPAAQPQTNPRQAERLRRLEQENAALRTEVQDLRRRLERFTVMQEALFATGRLPR
jgi:hypothetical protein